jgi:nucleoid DNA-binding protein
MPKLQNGPVYKDKDLVDLVTKKLDSEFKEHYFSKDEVKNLTNLILDSILELGYSENSLTLRNFGNFYIKEIPAMDRRAPNNKIVQAPGYRNLAFKPAHNLKKIIKG